MNFLEKYGIKIKNQELLLSALTHTSFAYENKVESYERLEFLGDAVLQLIISEYLYKNTKKNEGQMSRERASYVCEDALAYYAKKVGIDKFIRVGHGLHNSVNNTIIADTFEAVLAVIFLENGLSVCKKYIYKVVIPYIEKNQIFFKDYKTMLQELVQTDKKTLEYALVSTSGKAHEMIFNVNVLIDGIVLGSGRGRSKKEAEQNAAAQALKKSAR